MSETPREAVVVSRIMKALREAGYVVWKIQGNGYQKKGLPDLVTIANNGRFVGLEVKRPKPSGYGATALQVDTLRKINRAGGLGCIVRSVEEAMGAMRCAEDGRAIGTDDRLEAGDLGHDRL